MSNLVLQKVILEYVYVVTNHKNGMYNNEIDVLGFLRL